NFIEVIMQSYVNNPALRSQLESQVNYMTELSQKTYNALRKVMELNLRAAQQAIEDSIEASRQLMSCTDPMQLAGAAIAQIQPAAERMRDYQQQLMGVLTGAAVRQPA